VFILFSCFIFNSIYAYSENNISFQTSVSNSDYILSGDVLYKIDACNKIRLYDRVAAISKEKDTFYYIRSSGDKWITGFLKSGSVKSSEFEIPGVYEKLYKFTGFNEIFYILADTVNETGSEIPAKKRLLIRFNPDNNKYQAVEEVMDFTLLNGKPVVLKNHSIDYNGMVIPHLLNGDVKILNIIDSRIVFISDGETTEMVDLLSCMSFYQYGDNRVPECSEDYNLIVEFTDIITGSDNVIQSGETVYYEILIDGVEENRTETGRGEISKIFYASLDPGKYHIVRPERWELDKNKGRYVRVNNISQPGEFKIFIPDHRVIKIKLEFNGSGYKVNQSVLFKKEGG